jgi:hypothetical protein
MLHTNFKNKNHFKKCYCTQRFMMMVCLNLPNIWPKQGQTTERNVRPHNQPWVYIIGSQNSSVSVVTSL